MRIFNRSFFYNIMKFILYVITSISPVLATQLVYFFHCHKFLNLKNPKSFDEKINYLKLFVYNKSPLVTECADKVAVRNYVERCGCGEILNDIIGVYNSPDDIDWDKLPERFVIKCNHASSFNIICKDKSKLDILETKSILRKWLKYDYGRYTSEIQYINIKPKLLIEKFIDSNGKGLDDYRIFCFNGVAKYIKVTPEEERTEYYNYYDLQWNKMNFVKKEFESKKDIQKPINLDKMIEYANKLSKEFIFVRVDLYNVNGKIYFGELTFTPTGGCCKKFTEEGSIKLGNEIILNKRKEIK